MGFFIPQSKKGKHHGNPKLNLKELSPCRPPDARFTALAFKPLMIKDVNACNCL